MESSLYYQKKMNEYDAIIVEIDELFSYTSSCLTLINQGKSYMEGVVIDGESFGEDVINKLPDILCDIDYCFNTIIAECLTKKEANRVLRDSAKSREENVSKPLVYNSDDISNDELPIDDDVFRNL